MRLIALLSIILSCGCSARPIPAESQTSNEETSDKAESNELTARERRVLEAARQRERDEEREKGIPLSVTQSAVRRAKSDAKMAQVEQYVIQQNVDDGLEIYGLFSGDDASIGKGATFCSRSYKHPKRPHFIEGRDNDGAFVFTFCTSGGDGDGCNGTVSRELRLQRFDKTWESTWSKTFDASYANCDGFDDKGEVVKYWSVRDLDDDGSIEIIQGVHRPDKKDYRLSIIKDDMSMIVGEIAAPFDVFDATSGRFDEALAQKICSANQQNVTLFAIDKNGKTTVKGRWDSPSVEKAIEEPYRAFLVTTLQDPRRCPSLFQSIPRASLSTP